MSQNGDFFQQEKERLEQLLGEEDWWDAPGDMMGCYELEKRIGEGGFGVVWRALQVEPVRRVVALKVLKPGMDTVQVLARFERERQVLAGMRHRNIAALYDAATTMDGRPCFAMELVDGEPVTQYCQRHSLSLERRLQMFLEICLAVQHAHQKGVIHRDIKPQNILVCEVEGEPVPKVIDFGISKLVSTDDGSSLEATLLTRQDALLGTPLYMSPEQLAGSVDVDTQSDVYSLGVVLYEILAGQPPFDVAGLLAQGAEEMRRALREDRPPRPSTLMQRMALQGVQDRALVRGRGRPLPADLDWVVMRALEKERSRRYASVVEFAADVRNFLEHKPVSARPVSLAYLASCWARRHRTLAVAASLSVLGPSFGLALALKHEREARLAQERAEMEAQRSQQTAAFLRGMLDDVATQVQQGKNPEALRLGLSSSQQRLDAIPDEDLRIVLLEQISGLYDHMGEKKLTLEAMEKWVSMLVQRHGAGSPEAHAAMLRQMFVRVSHGERGEAAQMLLEWRKGIEERDGRGSSQWFDAQHLLIRAWTKLGNTPLALLAADEALEVAGQYEIRPEQHLALLYEGVDALLKARRYEDALARVAMARELLERVQSPELRRLDNQRRVMTVMMEAGDLSSAVVMQREILQKSLELKVGRIFKEYRNLVEVEIKAGEHEAAIRHAEEGLALARKPDETGTPRRADVADCLGYLAKALTAAGQHDHAVRVAQEALALARDEGNGERISNAHVLLGGTLERAKRLDEAHEAHAAALRSHADRHASFKNQVYDLHAMAAIRKRQGRYAEALAHHQEAWRLTQASGTLESDPEFLPYVTRPALQCWLEWKARDAQAVPPPELEVWQRASENGREVGGLP